MVILIYYTVVVVSNGCKQETLTQCCNEYKTWPLLAVTCSV